MATRASCSWLNAVEGFFVKFSRRKLKHGVFHSLVDLQAAINRFVRKYNAKNPQPFIWNADPDDIGVVRNRRPQTLESVHYQTIESAGILAFFDFGGEMIGPVSSGQ